jgi:hypothetical protein
MATQRSSEARKAAKNRPKRIPSVKRLNAVRPLKMGEMSMFNCGSKACPTN